ncbi:hypothetical protein AB0A77_01975 [Streptomyces varsoviensis]|uniref:hypothetical protein n=1 Tax=Streptomyces varsoviensis TaxID=67373 RepID=UPI0033E3FB93
MRKATIEFSGTLVVYEDGDEWEGTEMTGDELRGWLGHAMARGDKHAGNYIFYGGRPTSVTYEEADEEE